MLKIWNLDLDSSPRVNHRANRRVFRLAEVFLMVAECENELNGAANAY
ncbi:RagB/SusD family nutrient uptake outer membrane protein [Aestuariivivens sediminis]|nr:RagB/SusD family nutrient uptake outer membrane protein [Aestuariivivens sediminis]